MRVDIRLRSGLLTVQDLLEQLRQLSGSTVGGRMTWHLQGNVSGELLSESLVKRALALGDERWKLNLDQGGLSARRRGGPLSSLMVCYGRWWPTELEGKEKMTSQEKNEKNVILVCSGSSHLDISQRISQERNFKKYATCPDKTSGITSQKLSDLGKAFSYVAIPCSYLQHWDNGKSGHILTSQEGLHLTKNIRCEKQLNPSRAFSTMFV
ncbi:hypothetical protein MJG53_011668 [Ovis ammon polii x Ovis aries]|uniref:Uncharacterized protein n=1 Tax=Ovis ammon polii x Ovis aries TaxID=2918886 RepID=A0ACB9UQ56_9CETA|nr:hypothetical protein MJG53_011668 [Ovis ammon polii x Ovis aries]